MIEHGHDRKGKRSPTYISWITMRNRCENPSNARYKYYGGRGVKVCADWLEIKNFLAYMGVRPAGKTLDRLPDKNGNYEPGNCRWATSREQNLNKNQRAFPVGSRGTRFESGRSKPWSASIGYSRKRFYLGWFETEEEAHQAYTQARKELENGGAVTSKVDHNE